MELYTSTVQSTVEFYLFRLLTRVGFSADYADELAEQYMIMLRTSTFTKTGTYNVHVYADSDTGVIKLHVPGSQIRNGRDLNITIKELRYRKRNWLFFHTYRVVKACN